MEIFPLRKRGNIMRLVPFENCSWWSKQNCICNSLDPSQRTKLTHGFGIGFCSVVSAELWNRLSLNFMGGGRGTKNITGYIKLYHHQRKTEDWWAECTSSTWRLLCRVSLCISAAKLFIALSSKFIMTRNLNLKKKKEEEEKRKKKNAITLRYTEV